MFYNIISISFYVLVFFNLIVGTIVVLFGRKNASSTWAWLMDVFFVPYVGFLIYLILGLDSKKHKVFREKARQDDEFIEGIREERFSGMEFSRDMKDKAVDLKEYYGEERNRSFNDLVYLNCASGGGAFSDNNEVRVYFNGKDKFGDLILDIEKADKNIFMLYYIMHSDKLGERIIEALARKAGEGLEVKLLLDGMGNKGNAAKFYAPLIEAGGQVQMFTPPRIIRLNYRNHRKIAVIDGVIGYVGGLNIGDEYLGESERFGHWRDSHVRVIGDIVKDLSVRFMVDWNFSAKRKSYLRSKIYKVANKCSIDEHLSVQTKSVVNECIKADEKYFPDNLPIVKKVAMQIVSSGPDTKWESIHLAYIKMIMEADKSVYIQTPYFSPDDSVLKALKIASLSGIDVRIMIPAKPDHPFVYWASLSFLGELLETGVRCYEYEKGFVHSKLMIVDGILTSTGTANMDIRSFVLNFEINAFIYNKEVTEIFEKKFIEDLEDCHEITLETYKKRKGFVRVKESVARLISPLL